MRKFKSRVIIACLLCIICCNSSPAQAQRSAETLATNKSNAQVQLEKISGSDPETPDSIEGQRKQLQLDFALIEVEELRIAADEIDTQIRQFILEGDPAEKIEKYRADANNLRDKAERIADQYNIGDLKGLAPTYYSRLRTAGLQPSRNQSAQNNFGDWNTSLVNNLGQMSDATINTRQQFPVVKLSEEEIQKNTMLMEKVQALRIGQSGKPSDRQIEELKTVIRELFILQNRRFEARVSELENELDGLRKLHSERVNNEEALIQSTVETILGFAPKSGEASDLLDDKQK